MLHALTLLPLVAPAPAPASDALLSVVPADAVFCVHASNPKALVASRDTSDWIAFGLDARWDSIVDDIVEASIEDKEGKWARRIGDEVKRTRQLMIDAAADCTGAVVFGRYADGGMHVGLVAEGGDIFGDLVSRTVGSDAQSVEVMPGVDALVGERGRTELFLRHAGKVMAFSAPTVDAARAMARESLAKLETPGVAGPLAVAGVAALRQPSALEFAVNLDPLWDLVAEEEGPMEGFEARVFQAVRSMDWVYGAATIGDGEASSWELAVPYAEESLVGDALSFFGNANTALLADVPAGASTAAVFSFDVGGFADWAMGLVKTVDENAYSQMMGGIEGASGMVGFDLLDDVVRNFTGDFVAFNEPTGMRFDDFVVPGDAPTFIAMVDDSDVMLDVLDTVIEMSGASAFTTSAERALPGAAGELEVWNSTDEAPMDMGMGVGAGRIAFSMTPGGAGLGRYLDRLAGDGGVQSFLGDKKLAKAAKDARGAVVSLQSTASMASSIEQMAAMYKTMIDSLEGLSNLDGEDTNGVPVTDRTQHMVDAANRAAGMIRQYFEGTMTTEVQLEGGLMRLVMRSN